MNRVAAAFLIGLLSHSTAGAAEPNPHRSASLDLSQTTLRRAITVEAARLAASAPRGERLAHPVQAPKKADTRHGCVRHGTACGALVGFATGFVVGLMTAPEDFEPMGFGLIFSGPIGAGIGAAVGWGIAEGTKPQP